MSSASDFAQTDFKEYHETFEMPDGFRYTLIDGQMWNLDKGEYGYHPEKFSKKQNRHFMRLFSGMTYAVAKKERLTFLTLSTQYDLKLNECGYPILVNGRHVPADPQKYKRRLKGLNRAFTVLKYRIERFMQKMMYSRYCKRHQLEPFILHKKKLSVKYLNLYKRFKFKLKYFKVKTSEGGGVLHICFRKQYNTPKIPVKWLKKNWFDIWASSNVNIKSIPIKDSRKLALYMVGQYMIKQPVIRASYGHYWLGLGVRQKFLDLIEKYNSFHTAKKRWHQSLKDKTYRVYGVHKRLFYKKYQKGAKCDIKLHQQYLINKFFWDNYFKPKKTLQLTFLDTPLYGLVLWE